MRIRILLNIGTASGYPTWREDEEVEADENIASALIARIWAVSIESRTEPAIPTETKPNPPTAIPTETKSTPPFKRKQKGD